MRLGLRTTQEAIALAAPMATLLAPFLTGVVIAMVFKEKAPLAIGALTFLFAIFEYPTTMFLTWLAIGMAGRFACRCEPWAVIALVICCSLIGVCVALVGLGPILDLTQARNWLMAGSFLAAGAVTGLVYAPLIVFWDGLLKYICEKQNGRLDGRPFARSKCR